MAILWGGGEDIDFPNFTVGVNTTGNYRSFARCGIYASAGARSKPFSATVITSAWLRFCRAGWGGGNSSIKDCGLCKTGALAGWWIGTSTTANKIGLWKREGTTWTLVASEPGISLGDATYHMIDMQIIDYGASGTINVFLDGSVNPLFSYSGNISISGVDGFDCVGLIGSSSYGFISEIIAADEDTRLMTLKTLVPNASGDTNEWVNDYTTIDEITNSTSDTVYTTAVDKSFQCNLTGIPTGDFICKGIRIAVKCTDGVGGVGVQLGVKSNSAVALGETITLAGTWDTIESMLNENPTTMNRFTPTEIEDLQLTIKSVAL